MQKASNFGSISPGQWVCQLSLMLGTPVSCDYVADHVASASFLTLDKSIYDQTIGKAFKYEFQTALEFLSQLTFAKYLDESQLILLAASAERF
jgi:hypothetical protein